MLDVLSTKIPDFYILVIWRDYSICGRWGWVSFLLECLDYKDRKKFKIKHAPNQKSIRQHKMHLEHYQNYI